MRSDQAATTPLLRGPPPAHVLQQQLALPSARPRTFAPAGGPARPAASRSVATRSVTDRAYDVRLGRDASITFFTRVRSSAALLVLLTAVGTAVALAIGLVLYLAGVALRHTLR